MLARNFTFNKGSHFAQLVIPMIQSMVRMRGNQIATATATFGRKWRVTFTSKFNRVADRNIFMDYDIK